VKSVTYKDAGVNIEKGENAVKNIKNAVKSTFNKNVLTEIGGFGGMYSASFEDIKDPVLVSSVDGVGTKLKIAFLMNKHNTIGQDLVNHCVNDIAVGGAKPLFFLDYFATGKLDEHIFNQVVSGFVDGCKKNNCALIGGETAEMPEIYQDGEYDISGTIVGIAEKKNIISGKNISGNEILIGVNSN
jgi:phosphoribosylformylglycinamidine cyclo-ligase